MSAATENVSYIRQTNILDPDVAAATRIVIAGCGTVGSNCAEALARAGFKQFHLIDMDVVEAHNLPSQAFTIEQLNMNKAEAVAANLPTFADDLDLEVQSHQLDGGEQFEADVLISAVDSMKMRKLLFELSAKTNPRIELFVDVRMGGNQMEAYAFNPHDERRAKQYEGTLYSDEEAEPIECGGRTFSPVGAMTGAFVTQFVTKHLREGDHPPYNTKFDFNRFDLIPIGLPKLEDTPNEPDTAGSASAT